MTAAPPDPAVSVYIVDDHDIVRFAMEALLQADSRVRVVGSGANLCDALEAIAQLSPDVVITDMTLGDSSGLETVARVVEAQGGRGVLVVSMHDEQIYGAQAIRSGAHGYIMKDRAHGQTLQAVLTVASGSIWASPTITSQLLGSSRTGPLQRRPAAAAPSPRELQVLELIKRGMTSKEIAFQLGLSVRTVDMHRANLKQKLGLRSAADLLTYALTRT